MSSSSLTRVESSSKTAAQGLTEFEILKTSHKFLRDDAEDSKTQSWEERLASKYYSSLYREFAVCDLKHYKSGNFSLRWRTEEEVLSGAGETTCGNTRCENHTNTATSLSTLELPFTYLEHGETKSALVKVVLCKKCVGKIMWKRRKDKEEPRQDSERSRDEDGRHNKHERRRNSRSLSPQSRPRGSRRS